MAQPNEPLDLIQQDGMFYVPYSEWDDMFMWGLKGELEKATLQEQIASMQKELTRLRRIERRAKKRWERDQKLSKLFSRLKEHFVRSHQYYGGSQAYLSDFERGYKDGALEEVDTIERMMREELGDDSESEHV